MKVNFTFFVFRPRRVTIYNLVPSMAPVFGFVTALKAAGGSAGLPGGTNAGTTGLGTTVGLVGGVKVAAPPPMFGRGGVGITGRTGGTGRPGRPLAGVVVGLHVAGLPPISGFLGAHVAGSLPIIGFVGFVPLAGITGFT